jgi:hypothetical protein
MVRLLLFGGGAALAFFLVIGVPGQLSARGARGGPQHGTTSGFR